MGETDNGNRQGKEQHVLETDCPPDAASDYVPQRLRVARRDCHTPPTRQLVEQRPGRFRIFPEGEQRPRKRFDYGAEIASRLPNEEGGAQAAPQPLAREDGLRRIAQSVDEEVAFLWRTASPSKIALHGASCP
jgi:hypothetical protein